MLYNIVLIIISSRLLNNLQAVSPTGIESPYPPNLSKTYVCACAFLAVLLVSLLAAAGACAGRSLAGNRLSSVAKPGTRMPRCRSVRAQYISISIRRSGGGESRTEVELDIADCKGGGVAVMCEAG